MVTMIKSQCFVKRYVSSRWRSRAFITSWSRCWRTSSSQVHKHVHTIDCKKGPHMMLAIITTIWAIQAHYTTYIILSASANASNLCKSILKLMNTSFRHLLWLISTWNQRLSAAFSTLASDRWQLRWPRRMEDIDGVSLRHPADCSDKTC